MIFPWQLGISFFILEINLFWIVWQWCLVWPWFSAYILDKCPYGCIDKKHPELLKTCFWSAYVPKILNFQLVWEKYQGDVFAISRCICNPWNFEVFFFFFLYFLKFVIVLLSSSWINSSMQLYITVQCSAVSTCHILETFE